MTPVDAMALVAGVAIGLALSFQGRAIVGGFPYVVPERWVILVFLLGWLFWLGAESTSFVVGARLVRYRRFPRPAEWLAILMTVMGLLAMGPMQPIDMLIGRLPSGMVGALDTFASWRWLTAGLATAIVATGLGLLRLARNVLPPWARTLWMVPLVSLTIAGPVSTIGMHGVDLIAPSGGFGPGRLSMLHWLACQLLVSTPLAMMLGIPAMAALIERVRRVRWRWTEWASTLASVLIALALSPLYRGDYPFPSVGWATERVVVGAWLMGVGLLSWVIVDRLGPAWSRWLGDQVPASGSPSIDASPASTLPT